MASNAVQCDKCQITYVKTPAGSRDTPVMQYNWVKRDACPDCKDAVTSFFNTGKLEHTCKSCGGNMAACEGH